MNFTNMVTANAFTNEAGVPMTVWPVSTDEILAAASAYSSEYAAQVKRVLSHVDKYERTPYRWSIGETPRDNVVLDTPIGDIEIRAYLDQRQLRGEGRVMLRVQHNAWVTYGKQQDLRAESAEYYVDRLTGDNTFTFRGGSQSRLRGGRQEEIALDALMRAFTAAFRAANPELIHAMCAAKYNGNVESKIAALQAQIDELQALMV